MEKQKEKAFDFAADSTKQLIGLSTAILALSVTFSKDIIGSASRAAQSSLSIAWTVFIVSIVFGIFTMLAMTGVLDPMKPAANTPEGSINSKTIRVLSMVQIFTFLAGVIMVGVFGCQSMRKTDAPAVKGHKIVRHTTFGADTTVYKDTIILPTK